MRVVITDCDHDNIDIEKAVFAQAGMHVENKQVLTEEEVIANCQDVDIFIVQYARITEKVMLACPKLKFVVRYGVGVDNIDLQAAIGCGITVGNVPDYGMNEVADHAISLALSMTRKLMMMNEYTKKESWDYTKAIPIHRFGEMTVGVIGLGRIGRNFAEKMHALGFSVIGFDPYYKVTSEAEKYVTSVSLKELLMRSDIVSIHCPAEGNQSLLDADAFEMMKDTAVLVNVARGGIVNEADLKRALEDGKIAGAALDCMVGEPVGTDSPLFRLNNLIVTPHMAWYSQEAQEELKRKVAQEAVRFAKGEPIHYPVAKPEKGKERKE